MISRITLEGDHLFECHWSSWSGAERYLIDGREIARVRSFGTSVQRDFSLQLDGVNRRISVQIKFKPGLFTLWNSFGYVARLYLDNALIAEDLLRPPYRQRHPLHWLPAGGLVLVTCLLVLVVLDGRYFASRLFGVSPDELPLSLQVINAAVATESCRDSLNRVDESLLVSMKDARTLRKREMQRSAGWQIDSQSTVLSVIAAIYERQPEPCQKSMLALMDHYLEAGADIDQRFGLREMTLLESAIMAGDARLSCDLLQRGARLEAVVRARRSDGTPSEITGVTLDRLAQMQVARLPHAVHRKTLEVVEKFSLSGHCHY